MFVCACIIFFCGHVNFCFLRRRGIAVHPEKIYNIGKSYVVYAGGILTGRDGDARVHIFYPMGWKK